MRSRLALHPSMKTLLRHLCFPPASALAAAMLVALLSTASAQGRAADQERALAARGRGETLPLAQILAAVERELPGRLIEIELDDDDGRIVYELELLLPDGRVIELKVDARTGAWLSLEGARLETVFRTSAGRGAAPAIAPAPKVSKP